MTKAISFLCFLLLVGSNVWADSLDIQTLAFLNGNWKGTLVYTDYQDDKTQVTLPTWVSFTPKGNKIEGAYLYQEPNGKPVFQTSEVRVNAAKIRFIFDEDGFEVKEKGENSLLLVCQGEDNYRKAEIHKKYEWKNQQLTITKLVKYAGENTFFVRNTYRFTQESDEELQQRLLSTLLGNWTIDLRPSPTAAPYLKTFTLSGYTNKSLSGVFYDTHFEGGKIHTDWGKIYFSFTTQDNSGTYFHSGYIENGTINGTTFSEGRGFLMPWRGTKQ